MCTYTLSYYPCCQSIVPPSPQRQALLSTLYTPSSFCDFYTSRLAAHTTSPSTVSCPNPCDRTSDSTICVVKTPSRRKSCPVTGCRDVSLGRNADHWMKLAKLGGHELGFECASWRGEQWDEWFDENCTERETMRRKDSAASSERWDVVGTKGSLARQADRAKDGLYDEEVWDEEEIKSTIMPVGEDIAVDTCPLSVDEMSSLTTMQKDTAPDGYLSVKTESIARCSTMADNISAQGAGRKDITVRLHAGQGRTSVQATPYLSPSALLDLKLYNSATNTIPTSTNVDESHECVRRGYRRGFFDSGVKKS